MLRATSMLHTPVYRCALDLATPAKELGVSNAVENVDKTAFSMMVPSIETFSVGSNLSDVILVGVERHISITQTALDLSSRTHGVYVLTDDVSSCNSEEIPIALRRLQSAGVPVATSESVLVEYMGDASVSESVLAGGMGSRVLD